MSVTREREEALGADTAGTGGGRRVAGVDEVGRGPLAGPVMACAVSLPAACDPAWIARLGDSKTLSAKVRVRLDAEIRAMAAAGLGAAGLGAVGLGAVGLGWASAREIDAVNILHASHLAMQRALAALPEPPDVALVDGNRLPPDLPCPGEALVGGDAQVAVIAAAAIVAKVARDQVMDDLDRVYPAYGWARNRGYGTAEHRAALARFGATPYHRRAFKPVREALPSV